jgi:hypothetical protein
MRRAAALPMKAIRSALFRSFAHLYNVHLT